MARPKNKRKSRPSSWQICVEGKTETLYLMALIRELGLWPRVKVGCPKHVDGCQRQWGALVDKSQVCITHARDERTWVVFDMDDAHIITSEHYGRFCDAFESAHNTEPVVIANAPCFEYWLLLHLTPCETNFAPADCEDQFKQKVNSVRKEKGLPPYSKDEHKKDPELFSLLGGLKGAKTAMRNADLVAKSKGYSFDKLTGMNGGGLSGGEARRFFKDPGGPCTMMPLLVKELMKLAKGNT